jgi:hypothetical protein
MGRKGRWICAASRLAILASAACVAFNGFALFEPFTDMASRADSAAIGEGLKLIREDREGTRLGFFGSDPTLIRSYNAEPASACEAVRRLIESLGVPQPSPVGSCGLQTRIRAGWHGWLINVWGYDVLAFAVPPDRVDPTGVCARHGAPAEERDSRFASIRCLVPEGRALVELQVHGKVGP